MASPVFDIGDDGRVTVTFSVNNTPTDPTTITARVKEPGLPQVSYVYGTDAEVVRSGTGVYYFEIPLTAYGAWSVRFEGTGNVEAAAEGMFFVRRSAFVAA